MKKRLITLVLTLAIAVNLLPLSGCGNNGAEEGYVTRGEWITLLAETFGMDSYNQSEPYYTDISAGDQFFPYVQSSYEWDVLAIYSDKELNANEKVTCEEVASTAAIVAGHDVTDAQFNDGKYITDSSVDFAIENGIIPGDKKLSGKMTLEECEAALAAAKTAYLTPSTVETAIAVANEDVIDLMELTSDEYEVSGSNFIIPAANSAGLSRNDAGNLTASIDTGNGVVDVAVGEVFVTAPTPEHPSGVAYKVSSVEEIDGEIVLTTESPTLADLYDELDVHMTVEADASDIIWAPGVTASQSSAQGMSVSGDGEYYISLLSSGNEGPQIQFLDSKSYSTGFSKSFEFGRGNFEKTWSNQNSSAIGAGEGAQALENSNFVYDTTPSIEDFNGTTDSWTKNLKVENKFSGGYKITGSININAITVSTDVDYKKTWLLKIPYGIETASVQVTSDITSTLTLEGYLSEELKIATIPIPIAATGLSVTVDLYLYANASGSLYVTASLGSSAKVEYSNNRLKHLANAQASATVDAAVEIRFGVDVSATLDALGIVKIVDAGAKAGGVLTADASVSGMCRESEEDGVVKLTYQQALSIHADLYVPTVNLYAGGSDTLIGSLGLSGSWDIMSKDKGAAHFDLMDYEWVFWEETVLTDEEGNVTESESTTAGEEDGVGASDEERLNLKTYVLTLNGESKRLELDVPNGEEAPAVIWTTDDTGVATVDETGLVSPVSTGYTIITVTLQNDSSVYVKCGVYVEEIGDKNWEFLPSDLAYTI